MVQWGLNQGKGGMAAAVTYLALYLAVTIVGYFIGRKLKKEGIRLAWIGSLQTVVIILLVFLMGSRIGSNREIVASLDTIGWISFLYTMIIFAVTVAAFSIVRRLLGFDRYGIRPAASKKQRQDSPAAAEPSAAAAAGTSMAAASETPKETQAETPGEKPVHRVNSLTILIVIFVAIGILAGRFVLPESFISQTGLLLTICLCFLLILIGIDIGTAGTLARNFRSAGWRVLVFPFVSIAAMIVGSFLAALVLPMGVQNALCVGSGFAWYSLAPVMLADYSLRVSAISFMHNVFREILGMLLVPMVAKRVGYIECYCLPGSTSMDVCLPVIERATSADVAVYSFICGAMVSASVPFLVSAFMNL